MKIIFTLVICILSTIPGIGQDASPYWDYENYPELPFHLEHLELDLTVVPSAVQVNGIGRYEITSRRDNLHQVFFHTSDLEIQNITEGEEDLEYRISGDSLFIHFQDTLEIGDKTNFQITWQSESIYGIHTDVYGNLWTSLNPKALHHWLPIFDHPRLSATVDATITIPAEMEVVFNGEFIEDEIVSTNQKRVEWRSETPIPVTGISLAVGNYRKSEAISGVKEISVFAAESALLPEVREGLLEIAVNSLKQIERKLSFEYPFDALNVVILPDHKWNEIQSGAGVIYLYQNLGSLSTQLRRGIVEQWFGKHHLYPDQIRNSHKYEFLKTTLLENADINQLKNDDSLKTITAWNFWIENLENLDDELLKSTVRESLPNLIQDKEGVLTWNDYAEYWYELTGKYWENLSELSLQEEQENQQYTYDIIYNYDELDSNLELVFNARDGKGVSSLVDVAVTEYGFSDTTQSTISFTGLEDSVEIQLSSGVENVTLNPISEADVEFYEQKPFLFLISQLRSANSDERVKAAEGLSQYSENPDLQLALNDALYREDNPDVKAAILETLGEILNGATGTEQTFLNELRNEEQVIQLAAIRALSHYQENENVQFSLRNILLRSEPDTIFSTALKSYKEIAGTEELANLAQRFIQVDSTGIKAFKTLKVATQSDSTGRIVQNVEQLLENDLPYNLEKDAINLLLKHQQDAERWLQILPNLLTDRDPRIRYLALEGVNKLSTTERQEFLSNREEEEYDPRILERIRELNLSQRR